MLKVIFKKYKLNEEIEFRPVYFNSARKTVINHMFSLENAFQETLYRKFCTENFFLVKIILDLLASKCLIGSLFSILSTL